MSAEDASEPQPPSAFPGPPKAEPVPPPVSPDPSTEPYLDLSAAVAAILNEDALSGSRKPLIEALLGEPVLFHLEIEKVERTFGRFSDAGYRNGRTVPGTIAGTEILVCVWYPEAQNEEVDSYDKGSTYLVEGTVEEWDTLRKRPNIRARRERG
jgi:hypothetical protein